MKSSVTKTFRKRLNDLPASVQEQAAKAYALWQEDPYYPMRNPMSKKLTEIIALDGSKIYIQYDDEENDELQAVGVVDDIRERTERFKGIMASTVSNYAEIVLGAVRQGVDDIPPSKIAIEFGMQTGGETGIPFVAKGTAQANVKILIEWNFHKEEKN